jgi:hypothetical protein
MVCPYMVSYPLENFNFKKTFIGPFCLDLRAWLLYIKLHKDQIEEITSYSNY